MNTYLLYCRFQKMRGGLLDKEYKQEIEMVRSALSDLSPSQPHWQAYLQAWS